MKRLIVLFTILTLLLLCWYFLVPSSWFTAISEPSTPEQAPEVVIPDGLFIPGPDVLDDEGNRYASVLIAGRTWLASNSRITRCGAENTIMKLADGKEKGPGVDFYDTAPRYGYYNGDTTHGYGTLYTHAAVVNCKLCPTGFRVAGKADWETLFAALGAGADRGKLLMKRYGSPFGAILGGRVDGYGPVLGGRYVFWWSAERATLKGDKKSAWGPELQGNGEVLIRQQDTRTANYVRCIKEKE